MAELTHLDELATEGRLADAAELDELPVRAQVALLAREDRVAVEAVATAGETIAAAVELTVTAMARGGRLLSVGAGTPGRLAQLDAAECPPTFGIDPDRVIAVMAGGEAARGRALERGEDDAAAGVRDLAVLEPGPDDVVVGISASGRTPYVLAALASARAAGAATVAVVSNPGSELAAGADVAIEVPTGPEVISGSTRLKAGTAQKLVLNAISTLTMVALGHTHGDLMVEVAATNDKLRRRVVRVVIEATGADEPTVTAAVEAADGHAKPAIVALLADVSVDEATRRLAEAGGRVREAIADPGVRR